MSSLSRLACASLLLAGLLPSTLLSAQDEGDGGYDSYPLLSAEEIVTTFYTPEHLGADELLDLAGMLYGRAIFVAERGGYEADSIDNLHSVGDALLIYDDQANTERLLAGLQVLDRPSAQVPDARPALTTATWAPGYISLDSAFEALGPFRREIVVDANTSDARLQENLSLLGDQNMLVLRDSGPQVEQMLALLASIDRPEPQLQVWATVVYAVAGANLRADNTAPPAPAELTNELKRLVPFEHFFTASMGLVRSSARSEQIRIETDKGDELHLRPEAFDAKTGTLTTLIHFDGAGDFDFETRTSITAGEYTVLGASGQQPLFLVLRIEPLAPAATR